MMAQGLPVIATDIGEISSLLGGRGEKDGLAEAGILLPVDTKPGEVVLDQDSLVTALRRLLKADLRARLAAGAKARFEAHYRLDHMVDRYAALYDDLGARHWKRAIGGQTP